MNRFSNYSYPSDTSMMAARRTAAIARSIAGGVVVGCILVVATLTGCQQHVSTGRVLDVSVDQPSAPQATDSKLDTQLRLDPSEIMFYTSNVHG